MRPRFGQSYFKVGKDDDGDSVRLRADYFECYARTRPGVSKLKCFTGPPRQTDDSPVYLFDNHFKHEKKAILQEYQVPPAGRRC